MLTHHRSTPTPPARVVILGAQGFVGKTAASFLAARSVPVRALGRAEVELLAPDAEGKLRGLLQPDDALVVIAAKAPCKDTAMLLDNIRMMQAVCAALEAAPVAHVVYVSSDAVYRDSAGPLNEDSCAEPGSLHGAMHLAREVMLKSVVKVPLAVLRPSLLYGAADPHNGYGPNRFRRLAAAGEEIVLFGDGEERRDHVLIDDVAELICRTLLHRSAGTLNVATGEVHSFRAIAERIATMAKTPVTVRGTPRQGAMPHNGYRPFDPVATLKAFPDFRYTPLMEGLVKVGLPI
jgi:nucleoside-diphosphate-sugar epimerase